MKIKSLQSALLLVAITLSLMARDVTSTTKKAPPAVQQDAAPTAAGERGDEQSVTVGEQKESDDEKSAAVDGKAASSEQSAPAVEEEPSDSEQAAPAGEEEASAGEQSASDGEESVSDGEESVSAGEEEASAGEQSASDGEQSVPADEEEASAGEQSASDGEQSVPAGEDETSGGEQSASDGEQSVPAGEEEPTDEQSVPVEGEEEALSSSEQISEPEPEDTTENDNQNPVKSSPDVSESDNADEESVDKELVAVESVDTAPVDTESQDAAPVDAESDDAESVDAEVVAIESGDPVEDQEVVSEDKAQVDVSSGDKRISGGALKSDVVDYKGWTVLKVEGFESRNTETDSLAGGAPDGSTIRVDSYPLEDLEENPNVRVLQEHKQDGFFHLAVAPHALQGLTADLEARGLTVHDLRKDLGGMIEESSSPTFRRLLPKGDVTFDSYMTLQQIEDYIFEFAARHPQIVTRSVIGQSVEGRDIHMLTLTLGGSTGRTAKSLSGDEDEFGRQIVSQQLDKPSPVVGQTLDALSSIIALNHQKVIEDHMNRQLEMIKNRKEEEEKRAAEEEKNLQQLQNEPAVGPVTLPPQTTGAHAIKPVRVINENTQSLGDEPQNTETHGYLNNIIQNMPYEAVSQSVNDTIHDTYKTLQEIIDLDQFDTSEYVHLDYLDEPEAVQLAYKVLQQIINYDPENRIRRGRNLKVESHEEVFNRIAKSLEISELISQGVKGSSESSVSEAIIKAEADIFFLLETLFPEGYFENTSTTNIVKESILNISALLPANENLEQDTIEKIASKIDIGAPSDVSKPAKHLLIKLVHLLQKAIWLGASDAQEYSSAAFAASEADTSDAAINEEPVRLRKPVVKKEHGKPVIFMDGGIHAREWVSPAFLLYTLEELASNTPLLLGAEWRLVPVLNPDGYLHSWTSDRMWRKNRARTSGCPGVDLNRNFGFKFGVSGTSSRTCSEIYRGPRAFSEPESRALKGAIRDVGGRLQAYISVHNFGQMILHPWGYTDKYDHQGEPAMASMGRGMADAIKEVHGQTYVVGSAAKILYAAAGGSDDWVSHQGVPYSYTMELRDKGANGFVVPTSEIRPTVTESWAAIEYLGNRIIRENPRSAANSEPDQRDEQADQTQQQQTNQDSAFSHLLALPATGPVTQPLEFYPYSPLVPLHPGVAFSGPVTHNTAQQSASSWATGPATYYSGVLPLLQNFNIVPNAPQFYTHQQLQQYHPQQQQHQTPYIFTDPQYFAQAGADYSGGDQTYSHFESVPDVSTAQGSYQYQATPHLVPLTVPIASSSPNFDYSGSHLTPVSIYQPSPAYSEFPSQISDSNHYRSYDDDFYSGDQSSDYSNTPFKANAPQNYDDNIPYSSPIVIRQSPEEQTNTDFYNLNNQQSQYSNLEDSNYQPDDQNHQYTDGNYSPIFDSLHRFIPSSSPYQQPNRASQAYSIGQDEEKRQELQNSPSMLVSLGGFGSHHQDYETEGREIDAFSPRFRSRNQNQQSLHEFLGYGAYIQ